jgi:dolichol-phosphate mannosyltransferase
MNKSISVIIPSFNEGSNILNIYNEIILSELKQYDYEIIFVDDGSSDNTKKILRDLSEKIRVKYITHEKNLGQSTAINTGIKNSTYNNIITIDADGQNNPNDIKYLLEVFFTKNYDLVGGIRKKRMDSIIKIISSRVANNIRSFILKDECPDTGCSLKVFNKAIYLKLPFFDGIHRFLPALFKHFGKGNHFIEISHRHRITGISKYGTINRLIKGVIDIIRVKKILKDKR